jgi:hypothetical protein
VVISNLDGHLITVIIDRYHENSGRLNTRPTADPQPDVGARRRPRGAGMLAAPNDLN